MATIACPNCQSALTIDESFAGQALQCPFCSHQFVLASPLTPQKPFEPPIASTPTYNTTVSARFKKSSSILDAILDFRFEKYVTPVIIRITWILTLIIAAMLLIFQLYVDVASLFPESPSATAPPSDFEFRPDGRVVDKLVQFGFFLVRYTGIFMALLWVRVWLETMIVLFNIAQSLISIDRKTRG